MPSAFRSVLISAGILAAAALQPFLHAQEFGGIFSGFQMNGITNEDEDSTDITSDSADIDLENSIITLYGNVTVNDGKNLITCNKMEIYLEEDAADSLVGTAEKPVESPAKDQGKEDSQPKEADDAGNGAGADSAGTEDEEEDEKKNIRKIVCIGDVVCTKRADGDGDDSEGQEQIAISGKAEFDVRKEIIVMTEAHSNPAGILSGGVFESMQKQLRENILAKCPVMAQGETWMVGESFTIFVQENNRMKVRDMKFNYTGESLLANEEGKDEEEDEEEKEVSTTLITTRDADIDLEHNLITLLGDVNVDDDLNKVTCNKMVVTLMEKDSPEADADETETDAAENDIEVKKDISGIVCTGDVVFLKRTPPDKPDGEDQIAMSQKADYDAKKEILDMTGKPVLMQGSNRLYGSHIKIYLKENNRMEVDAAKANLVGKLLSSEKAKDSSGIPMTSVTANRANILPNDKITLTQNVVVDDGTGMITCAQMDIFLKNDNPNSFFPAGNQASAGNADEEDENEMSDDVSKIVCSGNVVYRKHSDSGQEQVVLAQRADYDAANEVIIMTGAHSAPEKEISSETYAEIKRMLEPDGAAPGGNDSEQYSILMQGSNWIAGTPIKIFPKEGNRITITSFKSGLKQGSRSRDSKKETTSDDKQKP